MEEKSLNENGIERPDTTPTNTQREKQVNRRLLYYAHHPQFIDHRLRQLDQETSLEQVIETSSAALSFTGITLGILSDRRWLILSGIGIGLLLVKGVQRLAALTAWLQEQGYRTQEEIYHERYVLRALRGDFDDIGTSESDKPEERVRQIMRAMKAQ